MMGKLVIIGSPLRCVMLLDQLLLMSIMVMIGLSEGSFSETKLDIANQKESSINPQQLEIGEEMFDKKINFEEDLFEKIEILWTGRKKQEKRWQQVKEEMESLKAQNTKQEARILQLEQKLIANKNAEIKHSNTPDNPIMNGHNQIRMNHEILNKDKDNIQKLPSNCQDLFELGHTLSAFYLVQEKAFKKMATIFCDFQKPQIGKRIGYVNIKSLPNGVHFYVQRKREFNGRNTIIPFDHALINEGEAMNFERGIFVAPVSGIYHFQFKGENKAAWADNLDINLRLNEKIIGNAYISADTWKALSGSVHATLKLKRGDRVDLHKSVGGTLSDNEATPDTHFTGILLEEDLEI